MMGTEAKTDLDDLLTRTTFRVGDTVRAFHPRSMGVVRTGTIVKAGRKYAHIDFGPLVGGTMRVVWRDIIETV